jgi:predicted DNA binding protein
MSVIVEFTIDAGDFQLGRALAGQGADRIELERIIPVDDATIPFLWVKGGDQTILEADVESSDYVEGCCVVETVEDWALYRVDWGGTRKDLVEAIAETRGTILKGRGPDEWHFRVRFPDHQHLSACYDLCAELDLDAQIQRVATLTAESLAGQSYGLTGEQREAVVLALDRGYLAAPRDVTMEELAGELNISQQAFSERYRRGIEKILRKALFEENYRNN